MKKKKVGRLKSKQISITLPEREGELLKRFAQQNGTTRPAAARRMVMDALRQYKITAAKAVSKNQLELFDSLQVDIFNNASKLSD